MAAGGDLFGKGHAAADEAAAGDLDMSDSLSVADPMLGALLASMPCQLAEGVKGVRYLCTASFCSAHAAHRKDVKLFT